MILKLKVKTKRRVKDKIKRVFHAKFKRAILRDIDVTKICDHIFKILACNLAKELTFLEIFPAASSLMIQNKPFILHVNFFSASKKATRL
jgi:hypothetical protein